MMKLVHEKLSENGAKFPGYEAIKIAGKSINYAELDKKSNRVANRLRQMGITHKDCVGIYLEKSIEAIIGIFGILKAGAAYVPLDINNPAKRNSYIAADCQIKVVITSSRHLNDVEKIVRGRGPRDARIIEFSEFMNRQEGRAFHHKVSHQDLAAILYTSGSTGNPKGVMITHHNIAVFINWVIDKFEITHQDRFASHAPLNFDISFLDIFAATTGAACVILVPPAKIGNQDYIIKLIAEEKITIWQSVPSIMILMAEYGKWENYDLQTMRHLIFTGERMPIKCLHTLMKYFTAPAFHNIYGCTETNDTFIYTVPGDIEQIPDPLPIGMPLPYVNYKILNNDGHEAGKGEEGELYVSAPTVMRGYRGHTNERAVMITLKDTDGMTKSYYKTNDMVVQLKSGDLHLRGRCDSIIKSNGYRINLLEVENCIQSYDKIIEAAVFAIPDAIIGNRIIAIAVIEPGVELSTIELRIFCASKLTKYSIPHVMDIRGRQLPKTISGKIDRKKLARLYIDSLSTKN